MVLDPGTARLKEQDPAYILEEKRIVLLMAVQFIG